MPTYAQLMLSDPEMFGASGEALEAAATGLDTAGADFSAAVKAAGAGWEGAAKAAQDTAATGLTEQLDMASYAAVQAGATATSGGLQLTVSVTELRSFSEEITTMGYLLFPVPLVIPGPEQYAQATAAGPAFEAVLAMYEALAEMITSGLEALVVEATALDLEIAARIGTTQADLASGRVTTRTPVTSAVMAQPPPVRSNGTQMPSAIWQNIQRGNAFDELREPYYTARGGANEVNLDNGKRLDSYLPRQEIVSRKNTQLADIQPGTAESYLSELENKYEPGQRVVTDTAHNTDQIPGIGGQTLDGQQILEVPPQRQPVPDGILRSARNRGITIRDTLGNILT